MYLLIGTELLLSADKFTQHLTNISVWHAVHSFRTHSSLEQTIARAILYVLLETERWRDRILILKESGGAPAAKQT
jgi:hypothetical protein